MSRRGYSRRHDILTRAEIRAVLRPRIEKAGPRLQHPAALKGVKDSRPRPYAPAAIRSTLGALTFSSRPVPCLLGLRRGLFAILCRCRSCPALASRARSCTVGPGPSQRPHAAAAGAGHVCLAHRVGPGQAAQRGRAGLVVPWPCPGSWAPDRPARRPAAVRARRNFPPPHPVPGAQKIRPVARGTLQARRLEAARDLLKYERHSARALARQGLKRDIVGGGEEWRRR